MRLEPKETINIKETIQVPIPSMEFITLAVNFK